MKPSLLLHIGTHKTGTSAIQKVLSESRTPLMKAGVLYPAGGRLSTAPDGHHALARCAPKGAAPGRAKSHPSPWSRVLTEIGSVGPSMVIISSEVFEVLSPVGISQLREVLRPFEVRIVVYARNQLDYMRSALKQQLKMGKQWSSSRAFLEQNVNRCDYAGLLRRWGEVFGAENVELRVYDKYRAESGVVTDFVSMLKVDESLTQLLLACARDLGRTNASPGDPTMRILQAVNRFEGTPPLAGSRIIHRVRRAVLRRGAVTRLVETGLRLSGVGELYRASDRDWLRQRVSLWNEVLFEKYVDPADRDYFAF